MPCCCLNILNLCNVAVCGTLEINQVATAESGAESGAENIYSLVLDYLETTVTITQDQTAGENIRFNVGNLNENYQYTGKIYDSAGNAVTIFDSPNEYDCIKFKTIMGIAAVPGVAVPPVLVIPDTVVIEAVIDGEVSVSGTAEVVTGLVDASVTVTCDAFIGVRVIVIRGNVPIPGIDPTDGSNYFTKLLASDFITFSQPLVAGEFIRIQTIPQ